MKNNQFSWAHLGELYSGLDNQKAKQHFQEALRLARTQSDKRTIQRRIEKL